jgi:hypothetical protein
LWFGGRLNANSTPVLANNDVPAKPWNKSISDACNAFKDTTGDTTLGHVSSEYIASAVEYGPKRHRSS